MKETTVENPDASRVLGTEAYERLVAGTEGSPFTLHPDGSITAEESATFDAIENLKWLIGQNVEIE